MGGDDESPAIEPEAEPVRYAAGGEHHGPFVGPVTLGRHTDRSSSEIVHLPAMIEVAPMHSATLTIRHRLPAIFSFREFVEVGGLMSYGPKFPELGRRAATYVDKILKGAKPSDLPVQQPTEFDLVINLKT